MSHTCHAIGCNATIPPEYLMCYRHWRIVPRNLQKKVWSTYRPGQCNDWQPSAAYCEAAKAAVIAVAEKERKKIDPKDPKITLYDIFNPER